MDLALAASDAAICRGGAGTIADLWATRTPALILPYPYHKDEHQRRNAEPLEAAGSALVVRDLIEPTANMKASLPALRRLLDANERSAMERGYDTLGPADGAERLAQELAGLLEQPSG